MRVGGLAAVALVAFAVTACSGRGAVRSHLDGTVHAVDYVCKKDCVLAIRSDEPIDVPVPTCDAMDLAEGPSGKSIAYRCHAGPFADELRWSAVRLTGKGHYLDDCSAPLGTNAAPNFAALGPVDGASIRLLDCAKSAPHVWSEIARAIADESGADAAASFAISTSLRPAPAVGVPGDYPDGWVDAFDVLAEPARARVRAEICPALTNTLTTPLLFVRAARRCPVASDQVVSAALAWLHDGLAAAASDFVGPRLATEADAAPPELNPSELALVTAAGIAVRQRPTAAADISCKGIAKLSREGDPVRVALAASVLAVTKTRCAAVDAFGQLWPCDLETPSKTHSAEQVARFAAPRVGVPPVLPSANHAMFEALTINGQYPADYLARKAEGGFLGGSCQ